MNTVCWVNTQAASGRTNLQLLRDTLRQDPVTWTSTQCAGSHNTVRGNSEQHGGGARAGQNETGASSGPASFGKFRKSRWRFVTDTPSDGLFRPGQARKTAGHNTAGTLEARKFLDVCNPFFFGSEVRITSTKQARKQLKLFNNLDPNTNNWVPLIKSFFDTLFKLFYIFESQVKILNLYILLSNKS